MAYNMKSLAQELASKNMADGGLVAWGQNTGAGSLFGALGGAVSALSKPMHVISKVGSQLVVTPFTSKEILFNNAVAFNRANMNDAKLKGGLFGATLVITMQSGKTYKFSIMQGKSELKQILKELGL